MRAFFMSRVIRLAQPDDAEDLQTLYAHLIPGEAPVSAELARDRIRALSAYKGSGILVAYVGTAPVATVTLIVVPNMTRGGKPYAFIENVVTHGDHLRQGHARAIIAEAERLAWAAGCYRILIVSGNDNGGAHELYEACGYLGTKTGFQKRSIPERV